MSDKKYNPSDADDNPPPAYQETVDPPFNPNYPATSHQSPPHTPDINSQQHNNGQPSHSLYPQIPTMPSAPSSPPIIFPQPHHYQQQPQIQHQQQQYPNRVRYQAIEIPYNDLLRDRRRHTIERRSFPLGAIFFLFGWFCPPLWVIGACCCAGSRNAYESFWGKVNFLMAMVLIISSLLYSAFAMSQYMY